MKQLKKKPDKEKNTIKPGRDVSLRSYFVLTVFGTFCGVVLLSGLVIWGCAAFRHWLLPDVNEVYLTVQRVFDDGKISASTHLLTFGEETKLSELVAMDQGSTSIMTEEGISGKDLEGMMPEQSHEWEIVTENVSDTTYSIQKIERSYDTLTPKRKLAYQLLGGAMVAVPAVLSVAGILFCGFFFYRQRLSVPLKILSEATAQIAAQNLDFSLEYPCGDELGALCRSFELMRRELSENNKIMWNLLEQRRLIQASIAHDLRNPIAIIEGYTEYLQMNLPGKKLNQEKILRIVNNLNQAAKRLELYTESVRELNQLEDMNIDKKEISSRELTEEIRSDLEVMAAGAGVTLEIGHALPECTLRADRAVVYRILENMFENALRFADSRICVDFALQQGNLQITIADDGCGFPEEILRKNKRVFLPSAQEGHLGMGLAISRVLCEKHGGGLQFMNANPRGGIVKIILSV